MPDQTSAESKSFPKILFVHDYRPDSLVVADLIRQVLLGFPADKLEWWSCRQTKSYAQPDLHARQVHECVIPNRLAPNVRMARFKSLLLESFWVPRAARHLERVIAEVKPDLVVALLFGWSVPVLARVRWPSGQRLHVSVWDFPDVSGMRKILGESRSQRFVSDVHQLVRRASSFDAISTGMLAELQAQTGRHDGLLIHSGFEPRHLHALATSSPPANPGATIRLAYVGTIISESGFQKMLAALKAVRSKVQRKVALEFFGGRNYKSRGWFEPDWMVEHGMFTDAGLVDALRQCDWGIVVMDPESEDLRYSRFSFPNKVGTYLSAGVPILGLGNPQSSLALIMQKYNFGRFTSATDAGGMEKFFQESFQIGLPCEKFREGILRCAQTEFNAAEMRAQLWKLWGVEGA